MLFAWDSWHLCFTGEGVMEGKFLGRFFCLYLIGILHATTDHGELVPEEGRLVFLLPDGIRVVTTTRLKKKAAPYFEWKDKKNKWFEHFFVEVIWKIFKFSFILDQSQICISNGLGARACQSYLLICKNAHFSMGLQTEKGNVSTYSHAISKWIKLELPYWSLIEGFFKSFLTLHIFN